MNCQSFEEIVDELARDRTSDQKMEASQRESVRLHLEECTVCALRLQDERTLTRCLDELATEMKALAAPARVEEQLRKAFQQTLSRPVSSPARAMDRKRPEGRDQRSDGRGHWHRWIMAAAAVLLIVLGIAGLRLREGWQPQSQPEPGRFETAGAQNLPKKLQPSLGVGTTNSPENAERTLTMNVRKTNFRRRAGSFNRDNNASRQVLATTTAIADDTESEVATRFMPLGFAGPINLQDGGQLVRVALPRSAMLSLGLPVNMDRYSESVKADVFLDTDGLARAIRFVQ